MDEINFNEHFKYKHFKDAPTDKPKVNQLTFKYLKIRNQNSPFFNSASNFSIIQRTDEAMLNSILSFAVYDRNSWIMENIKNEISDMPAIVHDAMKNTEKMYGLKIWHFMKNIFEKIPDHELKIPAENIITNSYNYQTHFKFNDGQYSAANGLAHACILKSKNPSGDGHILHLSFRGTEFSRLLEYIKGPYLDMSAYYEHFKPLEKYIRQYVNNPSNNITELHVNGHSLGGAMVQEFLKNNPPDKFTVPIKGFTFGSPGSKKRWYHKFATLAYHTLRAGVNIPSDISDNINDDRITQFYHNNDPVPRVGILGYSKGGNTYSLPDMNYEESKKANLEKPGLFEKIPAFGKMITYFKETIMNKFNTKFHDSARYSINLKSRIDNYYADHPSLRIISGLESTRNWQSWNELEREFIAISVKYRNTLESLIKQDEPNSNIEDINKKIMQIRENMKSDSEADVILSKIKADDKYYKFLEVLTKSKVKNSDTTTRSIAKLNSPAERVKLLKKRYSEGIKSSENTVKKN